MQNENYEKNYHYEQPTSNNLPSIPITHPNGYQYTAPQHYYPSNELYPQNPQFQLNQNNMAHPELARPTPQGYPHTPIFNPPERNNYVTPPPQPVPPVSAHDHEGLSFKNKDIRLGFIKKVYMLLLVQFLITFFVVLASFLSESFRDFQARAYWLLIVASVLAFILVIILSCYPSVARKTPINYILLFAFTLCESYLVAYACSRTDADTVLLAAGITCAIVLGLTLYAVFTRTDFTTLGGILVVCLIGLIIGGIVAYFFRNKWLNLVICVISVIVFGIYLVFDTQLIIGNRKARFQIDDYVLATISLYLDIILIFLNVLRILSIANNS